MTRRSLAVVVGICVLLVGAWYLLLWSPRGDDLAEAATRREVADARVAELEVQVARLRDASRNRPAMVAEQDRLRSAVPDTADLANFLLDANGAATEAGVDFLSITPNTPAAARVPGVPTEIALTITVRGGYFQTLGYLDRLLTLPRVVVVDTLDLVPDAETGDLSVNLTARMFTSELPAGVVPVPPAPDAATDGAPPVTTTTTTPAGATS